MGEHEKILPKSYYPQFLVEGLNAHYGLKKETLQEFLDKGFSKTSVGRGPLSHGAGYYNVVFMMLEKPDSPQEDKIVYRVTKYCDGLLNYTLGLCKKEMSSEQVKKITRRYRIIAQDIPTKELMEKVNWRKE